MAAFHLPGPLCQVRNWFDEVIDRGTTASTRHEPPGSLGFGAPAGRIPIAERIDPGVETLVSMDRYGDPYESASQGRLFRLESRAARSFRALRAAAAEAGFDRDLFTLTSDYRNQKKQADLAAAARLKHGTRAAAGIFVAQGRSEHLTGRAMDLHLGISNSSENAKARAFDALPQYRWLKENGDKFGLNPYPYQSRSHPGEPWHWSFNTVPVSLDEGMRGCEISW